MLVPFDTFKKELAKGRWTRSATWEFDWYIDVFFVEAMAYGQRPIEINYPQPVVGDEFLVFSGEAATIEKYRSFFSDLKRAKKFIAEQRKILVEADSLIVDFEYGKELNLDRYEQVQKDLSLLMASVSVVFDHILSDQIHQLSFNESISEQSLTHYVIEAASVSKLSESNRKLIKILTNYRNELEASDFLKQLKVLASSGSSERTGQPNLSASGKKILDIIIEINVNDNVAADLQVYLDFLFQKMLKDILQNDYKEAILENLTFDELCSLLLREKRIEEFADRNHNWRVVYPLDGAVHYKYFKSENEFVVLVKSIPQRASQAHVAGKVACKGVAEGTVRIIQTARDLANFQKGEVLVAAKTQPRYVTAMTKAVAIVTDVGGITSHAAIISREFGIPCIVGTGNATRTLRDGDLVLVDAETGRVTVIESEH